jgi:NitT/TauT family transport system substrate-binding protein
MHKYSLCLKAVLIAAVICLTLVSCARTEQPITPTVAQGSTEAAPQATHNPAVEPVTLRIVVLPILDNLPMYVAQKEGLFEAHNVKVEFIPVGSAAERDQVIVAGQADGMINETISTLLYNKDKPQVQIVGFARTATPTAAQYSILANGQSGIKTPQDLKGVDIGISEGTIIEYITNRLLKAEGLSSEDIKTIAVPKIADRMALLGSGELKAATLPDPLSLLAIQQGASVVVDDTKHPEYGYSTYAFLIPFIEKNPEAIRGFLAAVEEATQMINADPSKWNNLLTEKSLVPAPIIESFKLPPFPKPSVPTQEQWADALAWAKEKGLVAKDISYSDSVNSSFLP